MTGTFIGVDVGTQSTKAVAIRSGGQVVGASAVAHEVSNPRPGWFEHDATGVWWLGVVEAVRALLAALPEGSSIEALGLTACGPCVVPVDRGIRPLRPGILYGVDTRAAEQVKRLEQEIGADQVMTDFGMPLTSQSVGPKIDWLAEAEPELYAECAHLLTANGFAAWHLTGELRTDHHQASYYTPYYRDGAWDRSRDRRGVVDRLPSLAWSDEVIGRVTRPAAAATGLPRGLPVALGSSDGLTAAYGAGASQPGSAVLNYGSTLGLTVMTTTAARPGGMWRTPGAHAGQLCLVGGLSTGGALTRWFVGRFAPEFAGEPDTAYPVLDTEAAASGPGAKELLLLPYFAGERTPIYDPGAAGVLIGLRLDHRRGDIYRALLEATGFGVRHLLEELTGMGVEVESARAVGGGTASALWPQIVSDITAIRQLVLSDQAGAAAGAAVLAARGVGVDLSLEAWTLGARALTPEREHTTLHDGRYRIFREAYERTRPLIAALAGGSDGPS